VAAHLRADGWTIISTALATQHGDDLVAERDGERLVVEAKGQGSSMPHSARFGQPFNRKQAATHVGVAVLRAMRIVSEATATAGIALPDDENHRREIERVRVALDRLGIKVFWVDANGGIEVLD